MRLLILISGILICGTGAFCFAFYSSAFADVAFLVGVTMFISGVCHTTAYIISGKGKRRLTETTLVEGLVTLLYGFSVLSNQVTESTITMFFGTWLTLCGITRFSQSLYVSRFNARDWSKIVPLAVVASMLGVVMMLPWVLENVMSLTLVGGAFVFDGLSIIVYAMYMTDSGREMAEGEARAKARAEAKKAEHEAQKQERERVRNLSFEEREKEDAERRKADRAAEEKRDRERAERRAARRAAAKPVEDRTIKLLDKEVEAINQAAEENASEEADESAENASAASKLAWNRPESIPSLRDNLDTLPKTVRKEIDEPVIAAVNLAEIEDEEPEVKFEKVELPEVELASDKESVDRDDLMKQIDSYTVKTEEAVEYDKIDLEELVREPMAKKEDPADAVRFTQRLDFTWIQQLNDEVKKKELEQSERGQK